ncbi:MAG: GspMb/PilO family protein [Planctomycetota bacterium]|jgi:hypothetical protein
MKSDYKRFLKLWALLWTGAIVLLVLIHVFLMLPQRQESKLLANQLAEKRLKYDLSKAADNELERARLNEKVGMLADELDKYATRVEDLDRLWFGVSRMAGEIGVEGFQIQGIDPESYSEIPNCYNIGRASAEVNFTGSFTELARFINCLERNRPIVLIDDLSITQPNKEGAKPPAKLFLSVLVRVPREAKLKNDKTITTTVSERIL